MPTPQEDFKNFTIGTFNVRGISKPEKQEQLARDVTKYNLDVCCLQETKIKDGIDVNVDKHKLITLPTDSPHYGNGFVVSEKWQGNIHRYWKVSDRISVLELDTN